MEEKEINLYLSEIFSGESIVTIKGDQVAIKHLTISNYLDLEKNSLKSKIKAEQIGLEYEDDLIDKAIDAGRWSEDKEEELKSYEWMISKLSSTLQGIDNKLIVQKIEKEIEDKKENINSLKRERNIIAKYSIENYIEKERINKMFFLSTNKEHLDDDVFHAMIEIIKRYNDKKTLLALAFSPLFFDLYMIYHNEPYKIFDKNDGRLITIPQKNIISYAQTLYNKLTNISMPDSVKKDPLSIYEYNPEKEGKKQRSVDTSKLKEKYKQKGKLTNEDWLST